GRVAHGGADQPEEMALDPVACEVIRDREYELVVGQVEATHVVEPRAVGRLVESAPEPTRNLAPQAFRSQLDWGLHAAGRLLVGGSRERPSIAACRPALNGLFRLTPEASRGPKSARFPGRKTHSTPL